KTLKKLLVDAITEASQAPGFNYQAGVLIDDTYGQDALNQITGQHWWVGRPVELPASRPIELEGQASIGSMLTKWPTEHVVKCLVYFHPDDDSGLRLAQERKIQELYQSCCSSGHELLLEIIPPADMQSHDDTVTLIMHRLSNLRIRPDWRKLAAPSVSAWLRLT